MPRKPKLFISHSSTDTAVAEQINAALADHFETFLDKADLQPGGDWQDTIERAIADCDAAIVMLSPAVTARPFWVSNEAFVLAFRRRQFVPQLLIVPVFLPGFTAADLHTVAALGPAKLDPLQGVTIDPAALDLAPLTGTLEAIAREFEARAPYDRLEQAVASLLKGLDANAVALMVDDLGLSRQELANLRDPKRWLAAQLLRADVGDLEKAHRTLAALDRPLASQVFRRVAPYCWVHVDAADTLAREAAAPPPKKALAMNALRRETPRLYVQRASRKLPEWLALDCDGDFSQSAAQLPAIETMLLDNVRGALAEKLSFPRGELPTDAELNAELDGLLEPNEPVVVLLPPWFAKMDAAVLLSLRGVFPRVAFLLWTETPEQPLDAKFADLVRLPELDPLFEKKIYRVYDRCLPGEPVL